MSDQAPLKHCIHCNKNPFWESAVLDGMLHRLFCECLQFTEHSTDWHADKDATRAEWNEMNFEGYGY